MKEYFYTDGKEQFGPFTLEAIKSKKLSSDTLVWTEGFQNWVKASEINEFQTIASSIPPPIPTIDVRKQSTNKSQKIFVIPRWLLFWSVFNLAALLLSYSDIGFFNKEACMGDVSHEASKFWPFTVLEFEGKDPGVGSRGWCGTTDEKYFGYYIYYNGLFYNYDIADFALFVGGAFFIFVLIRISHSDEKKTG